MLFTTKYLCLLIGLFFMAALCSSLVHSLTLCYIDGQKVRLISAVIDFSFGDITSISMFFPFLFLILIAQKESYILSHLYHQNLTNILLYLLLSMILLLCVTKLSFASTYAIPILYVLIVPVCFAAVQEEIQGTCILLLFLIYPFMMVMERLQHGDNPVLVQSIVIAIYITALLMGSEARARRRAQEKAAQAHNQNLKMEKDYAHRLEQEVEIKTEELRRAYASLERIACIDELTGVLNRRALLLNPDEEIERCLRYRGELCVAIADLDHFKQINDVYGHQCGDFVLQEITRRWKGCLRHCDTLGRYGGEEFVFVLPETRLEDLQPLLQRIKDAISAQPVHCSINNIQIAVTVSLGAAEYGLDFDGRDEVLCRADKALFQAKDSGRNAFIIKGAVDVVA